MSTLTVRPPSNLGGICVRERVDPTAHGRIPRGRVVLLVDNTMSDRRRPT